MRRLCRRWGSLTVLLLAAFGAASSGGTVRVWAQSSGAAGSSGSPPSSPQGDPVARSLRGAALQLASASLSDSSGGIMSPLHLPQRIVVLPLRVERGSGPPIGEPSLRARFMDFLTNVRHGDSFVIAPLGTRDTARIVRLMPRGVVKGDKPDAKVLDAARKAGADCVLYGTLSPPAPGRDNVWQVTWFLMHIGGSGPQDLPVLKASVIATLTFGDGPR